MPVPTPDELPAYEPHPTIGDRLALTRAESHAVEAERILTEPVQGYTTDALTNAAHRQATISRATSHATLAQAWAFIAMTYQGPPDEADKRWDGPLGDQPTEDVAVNAVELRQMLVNYNPADPVDVDVWLEAHTRGL